MNFERIVGFLRLLANETGGTMLDRDEHLVPCQYKLDLYAVFEREYSILYQGEDSPSFPFFARVRKGRCSNIIVRQLGRFTKCSRFEWFLSALHDGVKRVFPTR